MAAAATASRNARARVSLAKIAWLYLYYQSRDDWARASATLEYFQAAYSDYSAFVVEGLEELASRGAIASGFRMPTRLRVTGVLNEETATGMAGVLLWAAANFGYPEAQASAAFDLIIDEMPLSTVAVRPWFERLQRALPPGSNLYQYVELFDGVPFDQLRDALEIQSRGFIEGSAAPTAPFVPDLREALDNLTDPPREVVEGEDMFITAPSAQGWQMPVWGWVAAGVAAAGALGLLVYFGYKKSKGGRRR